MEVTKQKEALDQHFLKDKSIAKRIAQAINPKKGETIVEIGGGEGQLTTLLTASKVIVLEKDPDLQFHHENVDWITGNALKLLPQYARSSVKIAGNIPYAISEPLFKVLIQCDWASCTLLTGVSFFELITNPEKKWGLIAEQLFNIEKVIDVPPQSFNPPPKTNSVTFRLHWKDNHLLKAFLRKNKQKVKNALREALCEAKGWTKRQSTTKVAEFPQKILDKQFYTLTEKEAVILLKQIIVLSQE